MLPVSNRQSTADSYSLAHIHVPCVIRYNLLWGVTKTFMPFPISQWEIKVPRSKVTHPKSQDSDRILRGPAHNFLAQRKGDGPYYYNKLPKSG